MLENEYCSSVLDACREKWEKGLVSRDDPERPQVYSAVASRATTETASSRT